MTLQPSPYRPNPGGRPLLAANVADLDLGPRPRERLARPWWLHWSQLVDEHGCRAWLDARLRPPWRGRLIVYYTRSASHRPLSCAGITGAASGRGARRGGRLWRASVCAREQGDDRSDLAKPLGKLGDTLRMRLGQLLAQGLPQRLAQRLRRSRRSCETFGQTRVQRVLAHRP